MTEQLYTNLAGYPVRTHLDDDQKPWYCVIDLHSALGIEGDSSHTADLVERHYPNQRHAAQFPTQGKSKRQYTNHISRQAALWFARQSQAPFKGGVIASFDRRPRTVSRYFAPTNRDPAECPSVEVSTSKGAYRIRYNHTDTERRWYVLKDVLVALGVKTPSTEAAQRIREKLGEQHLSEQYIHSSDFTGFAHCTDRTGVTFLAKTSRAAATNREAVYERFISEPHPLDS